MNKLLMNRYVIIMKAINAAINFKKRICKIFPLMSSYELTENNITEYLNEHSNYQILNMTSCGSNLIIIFEI